jgi:hypothetical protein
MVVAALIAIALLLGDQGSRIPSRIERIADELLANFNAGHFEAASKDFNAEMRKIVTPEIMASIKQQLNSKVGGFEAVMRTSAQQQDDVQSVEMLLRYTEGSVSLRISFDASDKVSAVEFKQIQQGADPLEAAARKFFSSFIAEHYDEAIADFSATLRDQLPPARLRILRRETTTYYGEYEALIDAQARENMGFKIIDLKTQWGKSPVTVSVVFDNESHIAGLRIAPQE